MNRVECRYAGMNGYCDSTACHNMNLVGNIIHKERPENMNIANSSIWAKPQSHWHTGTPTEEGWYLFVYKHLDSFRYATDYYFVNRGWVFSVDKSKMLAWMPIEPYKED